MGIADKPEYIMLSSSEDQADVDIDDLWASERKEVEKDEAKVCKKIKKKISTM